MQMQIKFPALCDLINMPVLLSDEIPSTSSNFELPI